MHETGLLVSFNDHHVLDKDNSNFHLLIHKISITLTECVFASLNLPR